MVAAQFSIRYFNNIIRHPNWRNHLKQILFVARKFGAQVKHEPVICPAPPYDRIVENAVPSHPCHVSDETSSRIPTQPETQTSATPVLDPHMYVYLTFFSFFRPPPCVAIHSKKKLKNDPSENVRSSNCAKAESCNSKFELIYNVVCWYVEIFFGDWGSRKVVKSFDETKIRKSDLRDKSTKHYESKPRFIFIAIKMFFVIKYEERFRRLVSIKNSVGSREKI
jgi:hypothetical protein